MILKQNIAYYLVGAIFAIVLTGCSMIDENQDDCGEQTKINYELQLITNISTEIHTQLDTHADESFAEMLKSHLNTIFTDFAKDVNLSFYGVTGDSTLLYHDKHIMNDSEHSYTLFIPRRKYMHLALANIDDNSVIKQENADKCHMSSLHQVASDTIESQNTGLFTARQMMEMIEGIDQTFNVRLYMANCSAVLMIDPQGHDISNMRVFTTGFATAFYVSDSLYEYKKSAPIVRTNRIMSNDSRYVGFVSVNLPSFNPGAKSRSVIETTEPFITNPGEETLWEFRIYQLMDDNTTTETVLHIKEPLRAGQLKIIKARVGENGQIESETPNVGISVTLDWKKGGTYNPEL